MHRTKIFFGDLYEEILHNYLRNFCICADTLLDELAKFSVPEQGNNLSVTIISKVNEDMTSFNIRSINYRVYVKENT